MPNENLINASIDAATMASLEAIPGQIDALLPWLIGLTNAQRKSYRKMGPKHTGYVASVYAGLNAHKNVLPPYKNFADFTTDKELEEKMPYVIQLFEGVLEKLKDTDLRLRHELIKHADSGYKFMKEAAADDGNLEVKATVDSIATAYPGRGNMKLADIRTIAPKTSFQISGVVMGSYFTNNGETVLELSQGGEITSGVKKGKTIVNPGNSFKITKGWTTITVTNKSQDTDGIFSVKLSR